MRLKKPLSIEDQVERLRSHHLEFSQSDDVESFQFEKMLYPSP